ncbi:hypothetical protein P7K49_018359 [Saguinus oedipus]|uniref:Uncharacterized protein n=1 Tax=Saguinus oedipus TaxID=9490 RepID=A0ABQ9V572_SAGOE|nr:hypothetical protein P7K49_018359 [Saguinus oedipus]
MQRRRHHVGRAELREALQAAVEWRRARGPAMIASCLCYLLLPAARLFRALSGTGPAYRQAGDRPSPASAAFRGPETACGGPGLVTTVPGAVPRCGKAVLSPRPAGPS